MKKLILVLLAQVLVCGIALAKPAEKSRYIYYTVAGKNPVEIQKDLIRRSPRLTRNLAYAVTVIAATYKPKFNSGNGQCRFRSVNASVSFTIILPKLKTTKSLEGSTPAVWKSFAASLKKHEEQHRTIWRNCIAEFEREAQQETGKDCQAADKKAQRLLRKIKTKCVGLDAKLDRDYRQELLRHPFVISALGRSSSRTASAASFFKPKKGKINNIFQ